MGFVDRLMTRKRKAEMDDRSEYGWLVALEAEGKLSEADDAKLEAVMLRLGITQSEFQSHVEVVRKANGYAATIDRLKNLDADRAKTARESEKFDTKWKPILEEHQQGRSALLAKHEEHSKDDFAKSTAERELSRLRTDNPLAFGIPAPEPVRRPSEQEIQLIATNNRKLMEAVKLVGHLRDQTPEQHGPLSAFQIECLEYAEAEGKIDAGWAAKARKFLRKEPAPKPDIVQFPDRQAADSAPRHPVFS